MARALTIPEQFDALRKRAGLKFDELAKAMGYKGASGIQRYLDAAYAEKKEFLPLDVVHKAVRVLEGKGQPPITKAEILGLAGLLPGDTGPQDASPEIRDLSGGEMQEPLINALVEMTLSLPSADAAAVVKRVWTELARRESALRNRPEAETF